MKLSGWKIALAALVILAALTVMVNVTSHAVQATPAPGQIFIDLNGNMTYDPGNETLYATIQWAIDNATHGETVVVGAGTYTEQLLINSSINLVGASMASTSLSCPATLTAQPSMVSVLGASSVNLTGFTFSGPGNALGTGLYVIGDSYVHVGNCTFSDIRHNPVDGSQWPISIKLGNATSLNVGTGLIENCVFNNWQKAAIQVDSAGSYAEVRGCTIQGWSTSSTLVVQVGVHVVNQANAWIHDNTINQIGGTNSGRGIQVENGANARIEKNNLSGINGAGDNAIGVNLLNPGPSVTIKNNSLTYWAWGALVSGTVQGPRFESNLFALNRGSGIQLTNAQNTSILYNNFTQNGLPTGGNGLIITSDSANSFAHYNNFMGNNYGVYSDVIMPFDATLNYWGSFSGPSDSGLGTGDSVHEISGHPVAWNPWLKSHYPPAIPITGTGTRGVVDELTMLDLSASAGISVQMTGSASPLVSAFRYSQNPTSPFDGKSLEHYIDVRISTSTGVTQLTVTMNYNQTDVPAGMNESELRLFWWNGTQWTVVTDSRVDISANLIIADFRTDTQPTVGQLVGTAFLGGTPRVTLSPSVGLAGTLITAHGSGFFPFSSVTMKFVDNFVASGFVSWRGTVTVQGLAPYALPGTYSVILLDALGCTSTSSFTVVDGTSLDVQVSVGAVHFRGEMATFWASTSLSGIPVDVDNFTAKLYTPDLGVINLTSTNVAPGLYIMNLTIPLDAPFGDYAFLVTVTYGSHMGIGLTGSLISQTLTGFDARLTGIEGNVATIQTDVGAIQLDMTSINVGLASINGNMAILQTDVGAIQVDLVTIGANLTSINGSMAIIQTQLGILTVNISALNAHLINIDGNMTTIQTNLGTIQTNISSIQASLIGISGDLATIESTLGRVELNVTAINAHLVSIDGTLASVHTSLGTMQTSLDSIDARLVAVQGTVATINTTCGALTVSLAALDAKVVQVQGSQVIIQTSLGNINGEIVSLQGDIATIQTDMGIVTAGVKNLENNANNNNTFIIVLLLLIMVILIGLYYWKLRKVL